DFVAKVATLARTMQRAQVEPPPELATEVPRWRAFAAATGSDLHLGPMKMHGGLVEAARFSIAARFGALGAPVGVDVDVTIDPPLDDDVPDLDDAAAAASAPRGALDLWKQVR